MDIQFAKYKVLIEQQLEELIAEDVLGQSAKKTVELDQQTPRFEPCGGTT
jgi:DnaK suppressor protein